MHFLATVTALALSFAATQATPLNIYNQCGESIQFYDNSATETIASGGSTSRTLAQGFSGMFRNGVSGQATLAEFSITGGYAWYDISIIPTGSLSGPTTETPAPVVMSSSSSFDRSVASDFNSSSSSSLDDVVAEADTLSVAPATAPTSSSSSGSDGAESVSTQSEASGTSLSTYLVSTLGAVVVVAAVAAVIIVRRKKLQLEALEPKDSVYSSADLLTPRTDIHVLNA
ncbi:hypothetical protein BBJ28_00017218 [Nothophytophthora sp. Chile5]|nr:hypothetical protein BBJ28_00017218 [Nothophytophthora sp. Chile5]